MMRREGGPRAYMPSADALVRLEHRLDAEKLGRGPVRLQRIGDGLSNLTYRLQREGADLILRCPPPPPTPPGLYDVLREGRYYVAMAKAGVRVPAVLLAEDSVSILGVPFLCMERIDGVLLGESLPPGFDAAAHGALLMRQMIQTLATVHAVDGVQCGLSTPERAHAYLHNQLRRYGSVWSECRTRELPEMADIQTWLAANLPQASGRSVIHGDFRLGNVMFALEAPPRVAALLDWELASVGDPLVDLGYLVATWPNPRLPRLGMLDRMSSVALMPGFPDRRTLVNWYEQERGIEVHSRLAWYVVLALWRTAIGLETIYRRSLQGGAAHERQLALGPEVEVLALRAAAIVRGQDPLAGGPCSTHEE